MKNKLKKELTLLTYLIEELKLQNGKKEEVIPSGWFNAEQVATQMKRCKYTARCHIRKALKAKTIERRYFKQLDAGNRVISLPYYKYIK